jgi:drug/metabolite transporter (DMT)-like permease
MSSSVIAEPAQHRFGVPAILGVVLIWSGWIIVSSWGVHQTLTAWDICFLRFSTAAIITFPLLLKRRRDLQTIFNLHTVVCSLGCGVPYLMFSLFGLEDSPASNAGVVVNGLLPILMTVLSYVLLKQSITGFKLLGIVIIALANGLILIDGGAAHISGTLHFVLAALCLAIYTFFMRIWRIPTDVMIVSVPWINAIAFFPVWIWLAPSTLTHAGIAEVTVQVLYQGVLVSLVALYLMTHAIHALGSVTASTFMGIVPVAAALLAYLVLHEHIGTLTAVAVVLCSIGIVLYNIAGRLTPAGKI